MKSSHLKNAFWIAFLASLLYGIWFAVAPSLAPLFVVRHSAWPYERMFACSVLEHAQLATLKESRSRDVRIDSVLESVIHDDPDDMVRRAARAARFFMVDLREGRRYATTMIGGSLWMAENLAWRDDSSWAFNMSEEPKREAVLYPWKSAMRACPEGWRLPDSAEWKAMGDSVSLGVVTSDRFDTTGMLVPPDGIFDSSVMVYNPVASVQFDRERAYLWIASKDSSNAATARAWRFKSGDSASVAVTVNRRIGLSVRCLASIQPPAPKAIVPETPQVTTPSVPPVPPVSTPTVLPSAPAPAKPEEKVVQAPTVEAPTREAPADPAILVDPRDQRKYRLVEIGGRKWMAQNLDHSIKGSWCYDDDPAKCRSNGRLYEWAAARHACPSGWHLPSDVEWNLLETAVASGASHSQAASWSGGKKGFGVIPAGGRDESGVYRAGGNNVYFWSASSLDENQAWMRLFFGGAMTMSRASQNKAMAFSVRCVEN